MIIVWISIAVIVGSLLYLGISSFRTFKEAKPTINEIQATVTRIQQQTDSIKHETERLTERQQAIMNDVEYKKSAINYPVNQAKMVIPSAKRLWKNTPVAKLISNK
jgi:uncharacterized protein YoxC